MKIDSLTSLRFIAALLVFFSHLGFLGQNKNDMVVSLFNRVFWEGYIGVIFFFILSGFVLSYSYKSRFDRNEINLRDFWRARAARIYPMHIITSILFLVILVFSGHHDAIDIKTFFFNLSLIHGFFPDRSVHFSFNIPSWSLSVELLCYLLFPWLITLRTRYVAIVFLLSVFWQSAVFFSNILESEKHYLIYIFPFSRLGDFTMGILLFFVFSKYKGCMSFSRATLLQSFSVLSLVIAFALKGKVVQEFRYDMYYLLPMAFLVLSFSFHQGWWSKLLTHRWLIQLGEASFSFYLLHYLVIELSRTFASSSLIVNYGVLIAAICLVVSILTSVFVHKRIEVPLTALLRRKSV